MCAQGEAALSYKDVGAGRAPKVPYRRRRVWPTECVCLCLCVCRYVCLSLDDPPPSLSPFPSPSRPTQPLAVLHQLVEGPHPLRDNHVALVKPGDLEMNKTKLDSFESV